MNPQEDDQQEPDIRICICDHGKDEVGMCVVGPMGKLPILTMNRFTFESLRNNCNILHDRIESGGIPVCVRKAFEKSTVEYEVTGNGV